MCDVPADLRIDVGETYDVLFTPGRAGELTLRIVTTFPVGAPGFPLPGAKAPDVREVPVRVR